MSRPETCCHPEAALADVPGDEVAMGPASVRRVVEVLHAHAGWHPPVDATAGRGSRLEVDLARGTIGPEVRTAGSLEVRVGPVKLPIGANDRSGPVRTGDVLRRPHVGHLELGRVELLTGWRGVVHRGRRDIVGDGKELHCDPVEGGRTSNAPARRSRPGGSGRTARGCRRATRPRRGLARLSHAENGGEPVPMQAQDDRLTGAYPDLITRWHR